MKRIFALLIIIILIHRCGDGELRGFVKVSEDGGTYLVIEDDNGGQCGQMFLDGKVWQHPIGEPGEVPPGDHLLECGVSIGFTIKKGTTFFVDYWGP